ncbi:unnamed protein product [Chilo suppressalis]|uniref:BTB domain-containing protein n=1 Tax=Chilo suppressalis TaxID=168631 RepID=A0ABN8BI79_CHISP|nr:hypothetical protein evm_000009 [Chilo suppressalis]CAH0406929.1 unnamed protein product [Chilo suppressalis]
MSSNNLKTESIYNIYSESFKLSVNKGFAILQQQQEFVDLTIASGGYLVKAHKSIIALASPYIKSILLSTPCQHPVIFFSNISHRVLSFILEFVYTGEVQVPCDLYESFIQAAKDMHIDGLDKLNAAMDLNRLPLNKTAVTDDFDTISLNILNEPVSNKISRSDETNEVVVNMEHENNFTENLYSSRGTNIIQENYLESSPKRNVITNPDEPICHESLYPACENVYLSNHVDPVGQVNTNLINLTTVGDTQDSNTPVQHTYSPVEESQEQVKTPEKSQPFYTTSIRGSIKMILNRYVYNLHHQSNNGCNRRWRCIDYRRKHCPAYVDTRDEIIISRKNLHSHEFHDSKIVSTAAKKNFFTSLGEMKKIDK